MSVKEHEREYNVWHKMIGRCYCETNERYGLYGGAGVKVSERWKNFENFVKDVPLIDGYDCDRFSKGELQLDKDLKQIDLDKSEKIYSLETCTFMSAYENTSLIDTTPRKGSFKAISPSGNCFDVIGIKQFCRDNGLTYNSVRLVLNGTQSHHKGWKFLRVNNNTEVLI